MSLFEQIAEQIVEDVRDDVPADAGPDFVTGYVIQRFRMLLKDHQAVIYQP